MLYRRLMLTLSLLFGALVYWGLYKAAPGIFIMTANSADDEVLETFRVKLLDEALPERRR